MRPLLNGALRIERAIERALGRYSRRKRFVAGTAGLLLIAFVAMGADVWSFERLPPNRFTSMAILTGTWRLRSALSPVVDMRRPLDRIRDGIEERTSQTS